GATARLLTKRMGSFVLLSALLATIACLVGTVLSMELKLPVPSGASIIIVSATFFLAATLYRIVRKA
ncbi:metal ABC transporter permease, partial [Streptococcus suis]